MPPESERPVCVLSVGRSGTSLTTGVIGLLGVDLGPASTMLASNEWNPTGFWEHAEVNELNDEILEALGGSLWSPPQPPDGWAESPAMAPFRERAAELVRTAFGGTARWAFKDPRTVHTLPLWRAVVGPMDYVICMRHPVEVVASLATKLEDRSPEELYAIWIHATTAALRQTAGERRTFVFYEDWPKGPLDVSRRLAAFLHGSPDALGDDAARKVLGFFDSRLKRRSAGVDDLARADVPAEAGVLYLLTRRLAEAEADGAEEARAVGSLAARYGNELDLGTVLAGRSERSAAEQQLQAARLAELERERDALLADRAWLREHAEQVQLAHDEAVAHAGAKEAEAQRLHDAMQAVLGSRSWRATRPLRAASDRLRRDRSP